VTMGDFRVSAARIRAPESRAVSRKLVFLIYFLWHFGCGSYRQSKKARSRCGEQDVGTPRAVTKENEICVETRFERR
jgi:hypothetical protein